ncbi:methyltransferase [Halobacteriovorax sp. HLS]|uniref:methyltransferase n=1 Tax=Halobacteriovorax sp. HLS TaxID=2234000 RepID=UPI000FD93B3B|nr:methyltransferase [Halobacteriovorax sp. HLS]
MNFKEHFDRLTHYLAPYRNFWAKELLEDYPEVMEDYDPQWLDYLRGLTKEQLWRFDCFGDTSFVTHKDLKEMVDGLGQLTKLEKFADYDKKDFPDWAFRKVKEKKRHEITLITSLVNELNHKYQFSHTTDIGGGVGHLARILAHYYGVRTKTIDIDKKFQEIGMKRAKAFPLPEGSSDLEFIHMDFLKEKDPKKMAQIFSNDSMTLGLHTCGSLANALIETHIKMKTKSLLNFGCCYLRQDPNKDLNLSSYAQTHTNLKFTNWSLTIATRGYSSMSFEEFELKERVKFYRYTLHLLLSEILKKNSFLTVGDSHRREYWGDFASYAQKKLAALKIEHDYSLEDLNNYYENIEIRKKVEDLYLANIIRWQFGRALEHYILTDRCLWLEEAGHKVQMKELFDEKLSPRNIGILAL